MLDLRHLQCTPLRKLTDRRTATSFLYFYIPAHTRQDATPKEDESKVNFAVSAVIPCHNEAEEIEKTFKSILAQTLVPSRIVLVDDCSSDNTWEVISSLARTKQQDMEVVAIRSPTNKLRAGAINLGLDHVQTEFVVMMDADTILERHAIERAVSRLASNPKLGIICSTSGVKPGKGPLYRLQKLEYGNITAYRLATKDDVLICHGLFSVARTKVIRNVGGLSDEMILEDYDLTVKVKLAGYNASFSPQILAYTSVPKSVRALLRQRFRWYLGGLDVVSKFGWTNATRGDILSHLMFLLLTATIISTILLTGSGLMKPIGWNLLMALPIGVACVNWLINLYCLRFVENLDRVDILIRMAVLPELAYAVLLSAVQWRAYICKLVTRSRRW